MRPFLATRLALCPSLLRHLAARALTAPPAVRGRRHGRRRFVAWGATGAKLIPPGVSPSQAAHPPPIPVAWSPPERRRRLAPPPTDRVRRRWETTAPVRLR
jgi:hypothetical protein